MFKLFKVLNVVSYGLTGLFLLLDSLVYWIVSKLFSLYIAIAGAEIITSDIYNAILKKIEIIIGVFVLFYLAYALLKSIVNPDEISKTTPVLIKNFVIAIVLVSIVPTIFSYAFKFQNVIIGENKIGVLLLGDESDNNMIETVGNAAGLASLEAFLKVPEGIEAPDFTYKDDKGEEQLWTWGKLREAIHDGKGIGFLAITQWVGPISDDDCATNTDCIQYTPIISSICGIFLIYVLVSFCFDVGVRVFKLAFYQIIAPIPIMMYILPEKKSVLENWAKKTLAVYLEVFIRIFIMYLVVYFLSIVITAYRNNTLVLNGTSEDLGALALAFIIMGLISFLKIAPKMFTELIGLDSASIKLGIRQKLKDSGGFVAGAAIGGGLTTATRNLFNGAKSGSLSRALLSGGAGLISGAARSGYNARNSGNFTEMRNATRTGINAATERRDRRENYRASHGGTLRGVVNGHASDFGRNIMDWAGVRPPSDQIRLQQSGMNEIVDARKAVDERLKSIIEREKNERIASSSLNVGETAVGYNNLADLERDIKYLEEHGEILDEQGHVLLTRADLRDMNKVKSDLTNKIKEEILNGYGKDGTQRFNADGSIDISEYDSELRNTLAGLRNAMSKNYNVLNQYADRNNSKVAEAMQRAERTAINNRNQSLDQFLSSDAGNAWNLFNTQQAIFNASGHVNEELTNSIQRDRGQSGNGSGNSGS